MPTRAETIGLTIRNAGRFTEVLTVLIRYGFQDVVQELGLDRLIQRGLRLFRRARPDEHVQRMSQAERLRHVLEELGPTFIKLGQILSTRPDLIPVEWADEFRKLQDDVPAEPFDEIEIQLREEFGERFDTLFRDIEREPIAAGSMAQVHRATLSDDQAIVLKILRPGIKRAIRADMELMELLAEFVEEHFSDLGYSPTGVVEEFRRELTREVDLMIEARSTERFRQDFEENPNISFPRVFWQATTSKVLALEEIKGTRLTQLDPDTLSAEDRRQIIATGCDAVFRQCFEIGFFHADPHPGNIFVLEGNRVCFIDCGMTGHIEPRTAEQLAQLVRGAISGDVDSVVDVMIKLSNADPSIASDRVVRGDTWEFISRFEHARLEQLHVGELLNDFFEKIRRHNLRCPADIVFLIKAIVTIEGVGERIDPTFDVAEHVQPYLERLVRQQVGFRATRRRVERSLKNYTELLEHLPRQTSSLIHDIKHRNISFKLQHENLERLSNTIDHASWHIAHALIVAALVIGSSIVILAESNREEPTILRYIAVAGLVLAAVLLFGQFLGRQFKRLRQ